MVIRESDQVAWRAVEEEGWAWQELPFPVLLQSQMSLGIVDALLATGHCELPTFEESRRLHVDMLQLFLAALRDQTGFEGDTCPVT